MTTETHMSTIDGSMPGTDHVRIFDTTLRDGEQAPGFSMSTGTKLIIAQALEELKVDVIEAGFAAASPGDAAAISEVASTVRGPIICSLSRLMEADIDASARALETARRGRIHTFIGTSPLHREAKLKLTKEQVLDRIARLVAHAKSACTDIEFSCEDAIRTEREFLIEACQAAVEAGATTINIPDTVGYTTPEEINDLFQFLKANVPSCDHVVFSTHCHDDLGMAVANSLAAVRGGARQIECSINGIGERAGNCSLEEVVMAMKTRHDFFDVETRIDTTRIFNASQHLARLTHNPIPRNKAIVGRNAFAHESGIHQHGVLANKRTYEIMDAEAVGMPSNAIVLGKHSGKHALLARADALGLSIGNNSIDEVFKEFKKLADTCREVTDSDLIKLVTGETANDGRKGPWRLRRTELHVNLEDGTRPFARITMKHDDGQRITIQKEGNGPIDAAFVAVCAIAGVPGRIQSLELKHLGEEGTVKADASIEVNGQVFAGTGEEVDIADAAVAAFVAAINVAAVQADLPQRAIGGQP